MGMATNYVGNLLMLLVKLIPAGLVALPFGGVTFCYIFNWGFNSRLSLF